MRLRPEGLLPLLTMLLWTTAATAAEDPGAAGEPSAAAEPAASAEPAAAPSGTSLRLDDIEQAVAALKADPNLGTERKVRTLRLITDEEPQRRKQASWARWLAQMFSWLASSARLLVWVACGLLAALVVVLVARMIRGRSRARTVATKAAPTHVRDLDIRPESLPEDIGAAARQLWDSGEARRALALLYRGLLSKLAHDHHAPVRESTTEGDCVLLARRFLTADGSAFAARLVQTWSQAVYGSLMPGPAEVHALCDGFAAAMRATPAPAESA